MFDWGKTKNTSCLKSHCEFLVSCCASAFDLFSELKRIFAPVGSKEIKHCFDSRRGRAGGDSDSTCSQMEQQFEALRAGGCNNRCGWCCSLIPPSFLAVRKKCLLCSFNHVLHYWWQYFKSSSFQARNEMARVQFHFRICSNPIGLKRYIHIYIYIVFFIYI